MNVATTVAPEVRAVATTGDGDLLRTLVNSVSQVEAGLALGILRDKGVPDRTLVRMLNLRELLMELPASPFPMRVDFDMLSRLNGFTSRLGCYSRNYSDPEGRFRIEVLGQGNLCYDIVVCVGKQKAFLKPAPVKADFVRPEALELLLAREEMLREVIEIVRSMGMVFNPNFYMSVDDWLMEHAAESVLGMEDLF
ncbi:MAG: hypothetical protein Q7W30_08280 [Coriobacteriia bacterium]|nr:hypothetical protein [Coriobacteriia bacterium]